LCALDNVIVGYGIAICRDEESRTLSRDQLVFLLKWQISFRAHARGRQRFVYLDAHRDDGRLHPYDKVGKSDWEGRSFNSKNGNGGAWRGLNRGVSDKSHLAISESPTKKHRDT